MLSREKNELLTQVGAETPFGQTVRRYWIPALLSWELPGPDCPPVRVQLLGEDLVAFKDTEGRIGLLEERCPHRLASLYFGRNEECGLRCVYHGWKFDVDGRCVDMMNEPAENDFKHKIRTPAYPTVEIGGIVWAYLGPPDRRPPLPSFLWTRAPESHRHVTKVIQECNWLQALEGGIDTSHAPILHRAISADAKQPGIDAASAWVRSGAPQLELDVTDYGYRYAGVRTLPEGGHHVRAYHFVLPFHQLRPTTTSEGCDATAGHIWVPMDDGRTMIYNWQHALGEEALTDEDRLEARLGNGPGDVDQATFRSYDGWHNDYGMDRRAQKHETFTGIRGINKQDRAIQESMGRVVDRTREHLGPADRAITQARRLLLQAVDAVRDGDVPKGIEPTYYDLRTMQGVVPAGEDWRRLIEPELSAVLK